MLRTFLTISLLWAVTGFSMDDNDRVKEKDKNSFLKNNIYQQNQLFRLCCDDRYLDELKRLIEGNYFDLNQKDVFGNTILHWSNYNKSREVMKYLLSLNKIDINIKNNFDLKYNEMN